MAIIHQATLSPTKAEALRAWLPGQPWFAAVGAGSPQLIGAYRFDDPEGEVGIETHLVSVDGAVAHVPVTYRGAPLPGAESGLICTMEHSVLGPRWVYDGMVDPVYLQALAATIASAGSEAPLDIQTPDGPVRREPTTRVRGSGAPGGAVPDLAALELIRIVDPAQPAPSGPHLTGTWPGQDAPVLLAYVR